MQLSVDKDITALFTRLSRWKKHGHYVREALWKIHRALDGQDKAQCTLMEKDVRWLVSYMEDFGLQHTSFPFYTACHEALHTAKGV